jgi:hypothetical protein
LSEYFKKSLGEDQPLPAVNVVMVFTDDRVILQTEGSPIPALKTDQLKEFIRKSAKLTPLSAAEVKRITEVLPDESIV